MRKFRCNTYHQARPGEHCCYQCIHSVVESTRTPRKMGWTRRYYCEISDRHESVARDGTCRDVVFSFQKNRPGLRVVP